MANALHETWPAEGARKRLLWPESMRSSVNGKQRTQPDRKSSLSASLSVVVVSSGSALLAQRATQALKTASRDLLTQLIVVSQNDDPALATSVEHVGAEFVVAPVGSSRAAMCDLGMTRVNGSIVAVRDDVAIGDAAWLDVYRAVLPRREVAVPAAAPLESVVMDTQVAGRVGRADGPAPFPALETTARAASIEMAAAV
jgi:hypothetical protein